MRANRGGTHTHTQKEKRPYPFVLRRVDERLAAPLDHGGIRLLLPVCLAVSRGASEERGEPWEGHAEHPVCASFNVRDMSM